MELVIVILAVIFILLVAGHKKQEEEQQPSSLCSPLVKEKNEFKELILKKTQEIENDSEIVPLMCNFLTKKALRYVVEPVYINCLDFIMTYKNGEIGEDLLLIGKHIGQNEYELTSKNTLEFYDGDFTLMCHLIKEKISIQDNTVAAFVTYVSMMDIAKPFLALNFSNKFEQEELDQWDTVDKAFSGFYKLPDDERDLYSFTYYLMESNLVSKYKTYPEVYKYVKEKMEERSTQNAVREFTHELLQDSYDQQLNDSSHIIETGVDFELLVARLFDKMGYKTTITKATNDQGIDVIADNDVITLGIQAKYYTNPVGNAAIQEAVAGKKYYNCDKVMVITNSTYTASAIKLAEANRVLLWDGYTLRTKIASYKKDIPQELTF